MDKIRNIKGTKDILPNDIFLWQKLESKIHNFIKNFGYQEIRTPAFEESILFKRGVGEDTDIVNKEMYSWQDQGGLNLTLKPELTAPVVRAYIQHELGRSNPLNKMYYIDSLFRRERPQKGRQRQFNQFGVEVFGSNFPEQDAEVIIIAYNFLKSIGLKELILEINTIGSQSIRKEYKNVLQKLLSTYKKDFSEIDRQRLDNNPLRLFDSKDPKCREIVNDKAPTIYDYISTDDKEHFESVLSILNELQIPYVHNQQLVRGLDYYTRTTFEIKSNYLGAQDAICGGGRYDGLVEQLGGTPTPAVGFAAGMERIILLLEQDEKIDCRSLDVFIILMGSQTIPIGMKIADDIRSNTNLSVITETLQRSMRAQMREANRLKAQYCIIIGTDEVNAKHVTIKNMLDGIQNNISIQEIVNFFSQLK
tara:strand:+ start:851 stop:2113 length:1263 start_codon:yes stop_codon:yes gene_type:complete